MKIDEINFYPAAVDGKTFKEFCEHEKHYNLSKEKMKEVFDLLKGGKKRVDIKFDPPIEVNINEKPLTDSDNKQS
jgi:hypothetical protein